MSGTVGTQPISHDFPSVSVAFQRLLEEVHSRRLVVTLGHETLQHLAFVIDDAPQVMALAVDLHKHLVQMPPPVALPHAVDPTFSDLRGEDPPEPMPPKSDRLMADVGASLVKQALDITLRSREADIQHNRQADDLGPSFEPLERASFGHGQTLDGALLRLKLGLPDKTV